MTKLKTDELIRSTAKCLFARSGYDGCSIRSIAKASNVGISSIYHFFPDKDVVLRDIYTQTNRALGEARASLPPQPTAAGMLAQLIAFQFEHMEDIVFVLKYYLHYRQEFARLPTRTLPPKSVLHIEEVIRKGIATGEFTVAVADIPAKAKVIAHTINGYLLEYYPDSPNATELHEIINEIVSFANAGLHNEQGGRV